MKYLFIRMQSGLAQGLLGRYYVINDVNTLSISKEPAMVRIDNTVNFIWFESPFKGVNSMDFVVEWYGYLNIFRDGYYIIFMECDDGCIMKLDGNLLINGWVEQPPTIYQSSPIFLSKGAHEIYLKYFNIGPFGLIKLGWITPEGIIEGIPPENLYTRRGDTIVVRGLTTGSVVEIWTNKLLDRAVVGDDGLAFLRPNLSRPFDGYLKIVNKDLEFQSPVIRDIWGGDIFEVKEVS